MINYIKKVLNSIMMFFKKEWFLLVLILTIFSVLIIYSMFS